MLKKFFCVLGIMFFLFPVFAQESDDEPYLSIEDQEAILDKAADAIMETTVTVEHKEDSRPKPSDIEKPYLVRIEIYSRIKTSYIAVGDLSLEQGFFSWTHDGRKQNGYAVYMYPVTDNVSKITAAVDVTLLYGKSFHSAEEAIAEIQTKGTMFNRLIRYQPVVKEMRERLNKAPYQGGSR
ncbi:MAG: hypothetical protein LBB89_03180 [Treponema sp.]|jgi:hypothetical protein|nr:hypothetical protein [Treponema sp.]